MKRTRLRDLPALLSTPLGRIRLRLAAVRRMWPVVAGLAMAHRRTLGRKGRVIAIVGSLGKSSTRRAVAAALDLPVDVVDLNSGTPVAWAVLGLWGRRARAVIEVGISRLGQMRGYATILRPDVTVVTSIASEHHRSFGTLDVTRDEKAWMVRALRPGGVAVLNGDDPNVMWMARQTSARVVTYGFGAGCDVRAEDVRLDWPHGMQFRLVGFGQSREAAIGYFGRHLVYPALAAFAVACLEEIDPAEALGRLSALRPVKARLEPVAVAGGVTIVRDDAKSATESIDAALDFLAEVPARRRILVLGGISEPVGSQNVAYRRIGERVATSATHLLGVGPDASKYFPAARRKGMAADRIVDAGRTPAEVAKVLAAMLEPGDVVLVKGRDTQKLDRIRLILAGETVRCDIAFCSLRTLACERCPMLGREWNGLPLLE